MTSKQQENYICPITRQLMEDPVIDREGNSYDKKAILQWLEFHKISPVTRNPLFSEHLIVNRALKNSINAYKLKLSSVLCDNNNTCPTTNVKKIDDSFEIKLNTSVCNGSALISYQASDSKSRQPQDICVIVDVSGSMQTEGTMKNQKGQVERHGLSILDIVKHAVKTIISITESMDRISLVKYSTTASVVFDLNKMDYAGKIYAKNETNNLVVESSTNLWAGIARF